MTAPVSLKEYFAAVGSPFTQADAEVIGAQLEVMAQAGAIDQRTIVDTAQSSNSPLHRYFEWDNDTAADLYRLDQAGTMMRSIRVRTLVDGRPRVTAAYKLVTAAPVERPPAKGYNVLHERSGHAARMVTRAYDDLLAWQARYQPYLSVWTDFAETFRQVTNQIGEMIDESRPADLDLRMDEVLQELLARKERLNGAELVWSAISQQMAFMVEAIDHTTRPDSRATS